MTTDVLSRIATVVAVGEPQRLREAASALEQAGDGASVRAILISTGDKPEPPMREQDGVILVEGLEPRFLNNVVAALRLSSLPTLVWWRGGDPASLDGLAALADRVVLDAADPEPAWREAVSELERAAFSDLRWTRLTRWRVLMAQFFDIPDVRSSTFARLETEGSDSYAARLFAGWMRGSLPGAASMSVAHREVDGPPIRSIRLGGGSRELTLTLAAGDTCVTAAARLGGEADAVRTVGLGDQSLAALIAEELRVRARDYAFERALLCTLQMDGRSTAP